MNNPVIDSLMNSAHGINRILNDTFPSREIRDRKSILDTSIQYLESQLTKNSSFSFLSDQEINFIDDAVMAGKNIDLIDQAINSSIDSIHNIIEVDAKNENNIYILQSDIERLLSIERGDYNDLGNITLDQLTAINQTIALGENWLNS